MRVDVLVIGAGPAGIACAYYLQRAGIAYQVVDQGDVIASTWAKQYPTLRLNTSRFFSHMPGKRFPLRFGLFASAQQYHDYLTEFVAEYQFNIQLGVTVRRASPEGDGWRVETDQGTDWYPAVILASGRFPRPHVPQLPSIEKFSGTVRHSHDYQGAEDFAGQRVMVVGNGPSGVDLAVALPDAARLPVYLAQRTGIVLRPRYPYGLPKHAWMLLAEKFPNRITRWLEKHALAAQYQRVAQTGIKTPQPGKMSGAAGTRGPELIHAVQQGQVLPVEAPVDFTASSAILADGQQVELDAVILATGFRPALDYLDVAFEVDEQGLPVREPEPFPAYDGYTPYTGYEVQGQPGLYVVGVFYQGKGAMFNFNVEAEIIVQQIRARLRMVMIYEKQLSRLDS
jgi:hypothetical protein